MTAQEYNQCVALYADRVYRFILKNLKHEQDARDVVQQAFEVLWVKHDQVDFKKSRSYLFTTAYNAMIDYLRKVKRMDYVETVPESSYRPEAEQFELKEILQKAIDKLSETQRSVLLLRDYEGYSYKEIAEITELSESQVKVYIFRARKKMQEYLVTAERAI
ncbi:MAG: RNA polymerase sigma factor [Bacteroidota bacterium]